MKITETDRLLLRQLTEDDALLLYPILSDSETMRFYPSPYDMPAVLNWVQKSILSYEANGFGLWAIILKKSNQFIGQCGISLQNINGKRVPEIGYHIHKSYWGNGLASEAAKGCLKYGFNHLRLEEIFIHTYIKNIPSQRVAEKIGMQKRFEYDKKLANHDLIWRHVVYSYKKDSFRQF